jgi:hypothetical protein
MGLGKLGDVLKAAVAIECVVLCRGDQVDEFLDHFGGE